MLERMGEGSDGLGAVFPSMLNALMAFRCLGYADTHPVMQKARADFEKLYLDDEEGFRIQPCLSVVWDTAIAMIALARSSANGVAQALAMGQAWLLEREVRHHGDWAMDNPGVEPGGWAFEVRNDFYPDVDDTAMVLIALARAGRQELFSCRAVEATQRAFEWVMRMQCRDGGWAAFDRDVMDAWLEHVPFADHNAILDPSCSDVTARVMEAVGAHGLQRRYANEMRRAVAYLKSTQERAGCWYGRWGVNYLYGTWQVLRGLRAIHWDMTEPWVRRASAWIKACQNADGGWGESPRSYEDRGAWGKGPSTPSQTAWAIMGLTAAGHGARESVSRGVQYLIQTQRLDGWWDEHATTGTGFPRVFYLKYDLYRLAWPLIALREYARRDAEWQRASGMVC
jgi:squalene-hopene/tetraprenyl-beta-curcumene cyclase